MSRPSTRSRSRVRRRAPAGFHFARGQAWPHERKPAEPAVEGSDRVVDVVPVPPAKLKHHSWDFKRTELVVVLSALLDAIGCQDGLIGSPDSPFLNPRAAAMFDYRLGEAHARRTDGAARFLPIGVSPRFFEMFGPRRTDDPMRQLLGHIDHDGFFHPGDIGLVRSEYDALLLAITYVEQPGEDGLTEIHWLEPWEIARDMTPPNLRKFGRASWLPTSTVVKYLWLAKTKCRNYLHSLPVELGLGDG